jgi:6-pyruvoyltetrahydropterin/6-carboxytetrahydropterin synthase
MTVEIEGDVNPDGMIIDFYDFEKIIMPLINRLDHAFMVYEGDKQIIEFLQKMSSKMVIVDFQSTVENICSYVLKEIKKEKFPDNVDKITVRIYETEDDYAEDSIEL